MKYIDTTFVSLAKVFKNPKLFIPFVFQLVILLLILLWVNIFRTDPAYTTAHLGSFIAAIIIFAVVVWFLESWKLGMFNSLFNNRKPDIGEDFVKGAKIFPYYILLSIVFGVIIALAYFIVSLLFGTFSLAAALGGLTALSIILGIILIALWVLVTLIALPLLFHMRTLLSVKRGFSKPFCNAFTHVFKNKIHFLKLSIISLIVLVVMMLPYIVYNIIAGPAATAAAGPSYMVIMIITVILGEVAWLWLLMLYVSSYKRRFIPGEIVKKVKLRVVEIPKTAKAGVKPKRVKKRKTKKSRTRKKATKKRRR